MDSIKPNQGAGTATAETFDTEINERRRPAMMITVGIAAVVFVLALLFAGFALLFGR